MPIIESAKIFIVKPDLVSYNPFEVLKGVLNFNLYG